MRCFNVEEDIYDSVYDEETKTEMEDCNGLIGTFLKKY